MGQTISQLLIAFDGQDISVGNPVLKVDGITNAETYVSGIISLTNMGMPTSVTSVITDAVKEVARNAALHSLFNTIGEEDIGATSHITIEVPEDFGNSDNLNASQVVKVTRFVLVDDNYNLKQTRLDFYLWQDCYGVYCQN